MVHNVWTFAMGDSNVLREKANLLDKIGMIANDIYAKNLVKLPKKSSKLWMLRHISLLKKHWLLDLLMRFYRMKNSYQHKCQVIN